MRYDELIASSRRRAFLREPPHVYDAAEKANEVLADDFRILLAWHSAGIRKYSERDIERFMEKVLREIAVRVREGRMNWSLHLSRLKPKSRELVLRVLDNLPKWVAKILVADEKEERKRGKRSGRKHGR